MQTSSIPFAAPIVEVTLTEDRARVIRRGQAALPAGTHLLLVEDVSPVISDKTLTARILSAANAKVHEVRVVRFAKALREDRPADVRELEETLEKSRHEAQRLSSARLRIEGQLKGLDRFEELLLADLIEDAAWGREARSSAREQLDASAKTSSELQSESAALQVEIEKRLQEIGDLETRLRLAQNPATRAGARIEAVIEIDAEGVCEIQFDYVVPGACWRPCHTAEWLAQSPTRILFRSEGCVWQNTGEDWKAAALRFSTYRASLGTEPPVLQSDVIAARKKAAVIQVATREQEIQTTGLGAETTAATKELPGIDDGGEAVTLRAISMADIPSDGRPYRVLYATFEAVAEPARVMMPELARCAYLRTIQPNTQPIPILAGPVDLLRAGGFVGRTQVKFIAPGERFPIGWGPEGAIRVHRETQQVDEEASLLSGMISSRRTITLKLSNIGAETLPLKVTERVPVSEIEQVEITVDTKESTGGKKPDENGFIEWEVQLPPFGQHSLRLVYTIKKRKEVTGI